MNRRSISFILGLIILSAATFYLVAVFLPAKGLAQGGPAFGIGRALPGTPLLPLGRGILPLPPSAPSAPSAPSGRAGFFLRPFGLHRAGLPGILFYVSSLVALLLLAAMALFLFPRRIG